MNTLGVDSTYITYQFTRGKGLDLMDRKKKKKRKDQKTKQLEQGSVLFRTLSRLLDLAQV